MFLLRRANRALPRAASTFRLPLAASPSRFSSTSTTTKPASSATSGASTPPLATSASPTTPSSKARTRRPFTPKTSPFYKTRGPKTGGPKTRARTSGNPETPKTRTFKPKPPPPAPQPAAGHVNYFVSRTPSQQLPVYESKIRGGSVSQTKIRKIEGNIRALKDLLQSELGVEDEKIRINPVNNHIDIRGKHKSKVDKLLESRGF